MVLWEIGNEYVVQCKKNKKKQKGKKKEKMLATTIFCFSHKFFYPITETIFPQVFTTQSKRPITVVETFKLSANAFNLFQSKILSFWKELKVFEQGKIHGLQAFVSVFERVENLAGKVENAGYQHSPFFQQCFQQWSLLVSLKVCVVQYRLVLSDFDLSIPANKSFFFSPWAQEMVCRRLFYLETRNATALW